MGPWNMVLMYLTTCSHTILGRTRGVVQNALMTIGVGPERWRTPGACAFPHLASAPPAIYSKKEYKEGERPGRAATTAPRS